MGAQPPSATLPTPVAAPTVGHEAPGVAPVVAAAPLHVVATRASRAWVRVLPAVVLVAVMLMFVFQNLRNTKVTFATVSGTLPLALALLAAAALGGRCVLALGSVRMFQLRKIIHRSGPEK